MAQFLLSSDAQRKRQIAQEAALWLAEEMCETIDKDAFIRWRDADAAHAIAFARAVAATDQAARAASSAQVSAALSRRRILSGMAATGLAALLGGTVFVQRAYAWDSASSGIGECRRIGLPDGSVATLNTDSCLEWRFSDTHRLLRLTRGEVALDLAKGVPIELTGAGHDAVLEQGRYNARLRLGSMDITVLSGMARARGRYVQAGGAVSASALAGDPTQPMAHINEGLLLSDGPVTVRKADAGQVAALQAWKNGEILFDNEPLVTAVQDYNRYLTRKIVIADSGLDGIPVGGRFTSTDPAAFLSALQLGLGIRVSPASEGFVLTAEKNSAGLGGS